MKQEELLTIAKAICEQIGRHLMSNYVHTKKNGWKGWYEIDINGMFCVLHFSPSEKRYMIESPFSGFYPQKPFELPETKCNLQE